jgi:hypothetical protein
MALDDNDRTEINTIITKSLGVPEGKTLADVIADSANEAINRYDKGQKKERDKLSETLKGLGENVGKLSEWQKSQAEGGGGGGEGGGGGSGEGTGTKKVDKSKLDAATREALDTLERENRKISERLAASEAASATEKAAREKVEAENARRTMLDAVRSAALHKDVGVDAERVDLLLDHLEHNSLVRLRETGNGYEVSVGKDRQGDPLWEPLNDGLKQFVKTPKGAFFLPAVKGAGGGSNADGTRRESAGHMSADEIAKLPAEQIEKLAAEGKITLE